MAELVRGNEPEVVRRLVELEAEAFGHGGMNEWHIVPLIRHGRVYIIRKNSEIAGSVQYMLDWENTRKAYMLGVAVAQEWRGQGIGGKLLQGSLKALAKENVGEVELTVAPDNTTAIKLYEAKLGFAVTGFRDDEYGKGENRLVMSLSLRKYI